MAQKYYVGLDMGTASVGYAVTDDKYNIIKRHGKALWGVNLFKTADTAEERRVFRTARRRNAEDGITSGDFCRGNIKGRCRILSANERK